VRFFAVLTKDFPLRAKDFIPNRSLGFYEGGGTGQEHLGFVLQLNRLFPADLADFRRNWCLSSIV
jgi:hypothetical protein